MHTFKKAVLAAYCNICISYERYGLDIVRNIPLLKSFLLNFYYKSIEKGFSKNFAKVLFCGQLLVLVVFIDLTENGSVLKNQCVRKLMSFRYICKNKFPFCRIILNIWRKQIFLFLLFSKFRENLVSLMKGKSTVSTKIFFRGTL